eukprot:366051-Chlamydomonas_euryale.AAC.5
MFHAILGVRVANARLPQEVRDLTASPFEVDWHAVVVVCESQPEVSTAALQQTLVRKNLVRAVAVSDLFLRLPPDEEPAMGIRAAVDAHIAGGGTWESFMRLGRATPLMTDMLGLA